MAFEAINMGEIKQGENVERKKKASKKLKTICKGWKRKGNHTGNWEKRVEEVEEARIQEFQVIVSA